MCAADAAVVPQQTDIVIVGGGLVGLCCAYFLKQRGPNALDVTLIERDPSYRQAASALAVGALRTQFSCEENVLMSVYGAEFIRNLRDWMHVPALEDTDVQFSPTPHLILASEKGASQLGTH